MKEDRALEEGALEEARSLEQEQRSRADTLKQELEAQQAQVQRHLTQVLTPHLPMPLLPFSVCLAVCLSCLLIRQCFRPESAAFNDSADKRTALCTK